MQLVKINEKTHQNKQKKSEIGSFPEKEFRIMRVKMTKILKAK